MKGETRRQFLTLAVGGAATIGVGYELVSHQLDERDKIIEEANEKYGEGNWEWVLSESECRMGGCPMEPAPKEE